MKAPGKWMQRLSIVTADRFFAGGMIASVILFVLSLPYLKENEIGALADFLSVFAAIAAIWVSVKVWDTAKEQSRLAGDQLKLAKDIANHGLRPDVSVRLRPDPDVIWMLAISVENKSNYPAYDLQIEIHADSKGDDLDVNDNAENAKKSLEEVVKLIEEWGIVRAGLDYLAPGEERRSAVIPFRQVEKGDIVIKYFYSWDDITGNREIEKRVFVFNAASYDGQRYLVGNRQEAIDNSGTEVILTGTLKRK